MHCRKHLERMGSAHKKRCKLRRDQGLCITCGARPQFWGMRCIICRQRSTRKVLPLRARRALRLYREAEQKFELERMEVETRFAVRKLLAAGDLKGDRAEALRLYSGVDDGRWRTYLEVGRLMQISRERVRQLLYPSKKIITEMLDGQVPWKPLTAKTVGASREKSWREPRTWRPRVTSQSAERSIN